MNKEQLPTLEKKEKELTLEDVREYFQAELDFYSKEYKKTEKNIRLEEVYLNQEREIMEAIKDLGTEKRKYEKGLIYIEKTLGLPAIDAEGHQTRFNRVNHEAYGTNREESEKEERDLNKKEYKQQKNYLRRLAEILSEAFYKDIYKGKYEKEIKKVSTKEIVEIFNHIQSTYGDARLDEIKQKINQEADFEDILSFIDFRIYREIHDIEKIREAEGEKAIKKERKGLLKDLENWRGYRKFFLKKQTEMSSEF